MFRSEPEIHVGRYHGVIDPTLTLDSGKFRRRTPVADEICTGCHMVGGAAPDNFTLAADRSCRGIYPGYYHQRPFRRELLCLSRCWF